MESRGLIAASVWICVTVISVVIVWITKVLDLWTGLFILLLLCGAFITTNAVPSRDHWDKRPAKRMEGHMEKISKQLEELSKTVDYIKKQLEE